MEPLNPAGYLRALHVIFDGVPSTNGGPFIYERKRYRRAKRQELRCGEVWERRCQRKLGHDGPHWWRRFGRDAWWGLPDAPFNIIDSYREDS